MLVRCIACAALLLMSTAARPETNREFWPEFNAFLKLNQQARVYLLATTTTVDAETDTRSAVDGTAGVHLDYSLTPVFRPSLLEQDWARNRYLWARVGYQHARSFGDADAGGGFREHRGIFEMNARTPPLAAELEWYGRLRWDLRDRNGENSSLYRLRLGDERQFKLRERAVIPYLTAEVIYDTRYNRWDQRRYQAGTEVSLNEAWRFDLYVEARTDEIAERPRLAAVGAVLKYYH